MLSPYLQDNRLTPDNPSSPLPWDKMEETAQAAGGMSLPSLSTICTAASISTNGTKMLCKCDADSILTILNAKGYDTKAALSAIKASPQDFLTVWSLQEKELFNSGFRRYSGSLRMISKGIAPSKDFKDVIDYYYQFKIPDQFQLFQNKKREQAVHMMECIEMRRNLNTVIHTNNDRSTNSKNGGKKKTKDNDW